FSFIRHYLCTFALLCTSFNLIVLVALQFLHQSLLFCFFFNDPATTDTYTLSLHDALPIWLRHLRLVAYGRVDRIDPDDDRFGRRSEEHTSELQSPDHLVCRLLLEKKKEKSSTAHRTEVRFNR